jgi:hypothetical protein
MEADTANTDDSAKPIVEQHPAESSFNEQDIGAGSPLPIIDDVPTDQLKQEQEDPRQQKEQSEGTEIPIETKPTDPVPIQQDGNAIETPTPTPAAIVSTSIAPKLFRIAVNDELERLRITNTLSTFLEEVVEGNSLKSKNLLKVCQCNLSIVLYC